MTSSNDTTSRLREAPATRFSGTQHAFDLAQLSAQLQAEAHAGADGHRQITVFHHHATTMVLFVFENGGKLADHKTNGLVTIQILEGAFSIVAESQTHTLSAGQILVLAAGVPHSVTAHEASRMLLTVQMEKAVA